MIEPRNINAPDVAPSPTRAQLHLEEVNKKWYQKLDTSFYKGVGAAILIMGAMALAYVGITQGNMPIGKMQTVDSDAVLVTPSDALEEKLNALVIEDIAPAEAEVFIKEENASPTDRDKVTAHADLRNLLDRLQALEIRIRQQDEKLAAVARSANNGFNGLSEKETRIIASGVFKYYWDRARVKDKSLPPWNTYKALP